MSKVRSPENGRLAKFFRYVVQGAGLNLFGLVIFWGLINIFGAVDPLVINILTSVSLFPVSYFINRIWVFNSRGPAAPQIRRFIVVYGSPTVASFVLYALIWTLLPVGAMAAQILVVAVLVMGTFLLNAVWTFAQPKDPVD